MVKLKSGSKIPSSSVIIRFPDCDPFGHLNNSRYIDYFVNAREDHLRENYGLDVYNFEDRVDFFRTANSVKTDD